VVDRVIDPQGFWPILRLNLDDLGPEFSEGQRARVASDKRPETQDPYTVENTGRGYVR
jgi:hypothetical protein